MKPKTIIFENPKELVQHATEMLVSELKKKPKLVLGLPTGKTVIPLYKNLVKLHKKKKIDLSNVTIFNLDEVYGLPPGHKRSFRYFMDKRLFEKVGIKKENIHFLSGTTDNVEKEADDFEKEIKKAGGIDFQILGIGVNGHIAYNEPGSPFDSKTRHVILAHKTRQTSFSKFSLVKAPTHAMTMGIATILKAEKILMIATGAHKAGAVNCMLKRKPTTKCPASALQKHRDVTVLLDTKAAKEL